MCMCVYGCMDGCRQTLHKCVCIHVHACIHTYMQNAVVCLFNKDLDVKEQIWLPNTNICDSLNTEEALVFCVDTWVYNL